MVRRFNNFGRFEETELEVLPAIPRPIGLNPSTIGLDDPINTRVQRLRQHPAIQRALQGGAAPQPSQGMSFTDALGGAPGLFGLAAATLEPELSPIANALMGAGQDVAKSRIQAQQDNSRLALQQQQQAVETEILLQKLPFEIESENQMALERQARAAEVIARTELVVPADARSKEALAILRGEQTNTEKAKAGTEVERGKESKTRQTLNEIKARLAPAESQSRVEANEALTTQRISDAFKADEATNTERIRQEAISRGITRADQRLGFDQQLDLAKLPGELASDKALARQRDASANRLNQPSYTWKQDVTGEWVGLDNNTLEVKRTGLKGPVDSAGGPSAAKGDDFSTIDEQAVISAMQIGNELYGADDNSLRAQLRGFLENSTTGFDSNSVLSQLPPELQDLASDLRIHSKALIDGGMEPVKAYAISNKYGKDLFKDQITKKKILSTKPPVKKDKVKDDPKALTTQPVHELDDDMKTKIINGLIRDTYLDINNPVLMEIFEGGIITGVSEDGRMRITYKGQDYDFKVEVDDAN